MCTFLPSHSRQHEGFTRNEAEYSNDFEWYRSACGAGENQALAWHPHLDKIEVAAEGRFRTPDVVLYSDSLKLIVVGRNPLIITP